MLKTWIALCLLCIGAPHLTAQKSLAPQSTSSDPVQIFGISSSVSPPTLLGGDFSAFLVPQCEMHFSGKAKVSLIVDTHGRAQNAQIAAPAGNNADRLAIAIALLDSFTPGSNAATPVPVAVSVQMNINGCLVKSGPSGFRICLREPPTQKIEQLNGFLTPVRYASELNFAKMSSKDSRMIRKADGDKRMTHPTLIFAPSAEYSNEGRLRKINGACVISLVVDAHGLPQLPQVLQSLEPTMDQQALSAVDRYRFKPALLDGVEPTAVLITVVVNFRIN